MDLFMLGFMCTGYLKRKGYNARSKEEDIRLVVTSYVDGYIDYLHSEEKKIDVRIVTKPNKELLIILSEGEEDEGRSKMRIEKC